VAPAVPAPTAINRLRAPATRADGAALSGVVRVRPFAVHGYADVVARNLDLASQSVR
jgi:hypothetical protein